MTPARLTDAIVRELFDWAAKHDKRRLAATCLVALHGADARAIRRGETRKVARQRICDAINARAVAASTAVHGAEQ